MVGYTEVIPKTAILESSYLKPVEPAEAGCPKPFPPRWSQIADSLEARFMEVAAHKQMVLGTFPVARNNWSKVERQESSNPGLTSSLLRGTLLREA
jgi:hypothetical protein